MKYIAFIVGVTLLVLIGAFVWNIVSTTFGDVNIGFSDFSNSNDDEDVIVFEESEEDNPSSSSEQQDSNNNVDEIEEEVPPSQREGVVTISSIRRSSSFSRPQQISLNSRLDSNEALNITGWRIITNEETVIIPGGVNFYRIPGSNTEGDIIIQRGDRVNIYFSESPIDNNLRLNQCTGYLNERYDLDRGFSIDCPRIDNSLYRHLSGSCQDYINSINGKCVTPDSDTLNSFPGSQEGNECREFLSSHFNVGYCFQANQNNDDFFDNEWRVWIDERDVLDSEHDWVRLHNKEGLLIDERDY